MGTLAWPFVFPLGGAPLEEGALGFAAELRVRFPGPTNTLLPPSELSGALLTFSTGTVSLPYTALWYEKPAATALTGNLYLTSSAGRLTLVSASIFDDNFYNLAVVKEHATGSVTIYVARVDEGELVYLTSSVAYSGSIGYPVDTDYTLVEIGSSAVSPSRPQFWGQEFRLWAGPLIQEEVVAHAYNFLSYGRDVSVNNSTLEIHWRLDDAQTTTAGGNLYAIDSTQNSAIGTGSNFAAASVPYTKFLENFAYIPSIDYGWNQLKVRTFEGSTIDLLEAYRDERFVSLEFNMYDALNEDISNIMTSYDELNNMLGLPMNRYREDYEGLRLMRETYFKRLQGQLSFRTFVDMLDFFDSTFVTVVERLLPARTIFKGDELVVESHMLERPKYQYQLRPVREGVIDISGSIAVSDLWGSISR